MGFISEISVFGHHLRQNGEEEEEKDGGPLRMGFRLLVNKISMFLATDRGFSAN